LDQAGGRGRNPHHTSTGPNFGCGGVRTPDEKIFVLALIILALTAYWLLSFFGQSIVPCIPHTGGFIYMLAVVIVLLIIIKFLWQV